MSFGLSAGAIAGIVSAGAAVYSASKSGKSAGNTTQTQQQELDPRMQAYLYGDGTPGNTGILGQAAALANQPRTQGTAAFGAGVDNYLGGYGLDNYNRSQQNAQKLQETTNAAPQMQNTQGVNVAGAKAATINAPAQNNLNLSGAFDKVINGDAGANPYLTGALKSATDLTNTSYQRNQDSLTDTLKRSVLPGIRSNSVLSGQYGGSRQGIAEGNALSDYTKQLTSANLALGQSNSANTTGAQASAYNAGQDRSLSALTNLSGQQYGVASQDAAHQQQTNLANLGANLAEDTTNANLRQDTNRANLGSQLQTIGQNDSRNIAGVGLSSGLLGQAYNYATANDAYDRTKLGQVAGTLAPFTGLGATNVNSQPYYTNPFGNAVGGASAGLGLYNAFKNAGGGYGGTGGGVGSSQDYVNNDWFTS